MLTNRLSGTPAAAPALTARAVQQPSPPRSKKPRPKRSTSQLLRRSSHESRPRKAIPLCMLLIITGSLKPKQSRHSTATTKRRLVPGRPKANRKQLAGTPRSAANRATRPPAQRARKTTPTARHSRLARMLRTRRNLTRSTRLLTRLRTIRKQSRIGRSQCRSGKRDPRQALTPRGKPGSPTKRRSHRTKSQAAGISRNQKSEVKRMKTSRPRSRSIRRERGRDQRRVSKLINQKGGPPIYIRSSLCLQPRAKKLDYWVTT